MSDGLQLSARSVASLLAQILGPSFYDDPRFGWGDLGRRGLIDLVKGPQPEPRCAVLLNPQPLPPRELHALTLADAHIRELLNLDRMSTLLGGEVTEHTTGRALRLIAEIDELCPRWPRWPKVWPPFPEPPPYPWEREEMTRTELLVFGMRILAGSELMEQEKLQEALTGLAEKALHLSLQRGL